MDKSDRPTFPSGCNGRRRVLRYVAQNITMRRWAVDERDKLVGAIRNATEEREDGRVTLDCVRSFELAAEFGVTVREVSAICDEIDVRIAHCQHGCFE